MAVRERPLLEILGLFVLTTPTHASANNGTVCGSVACDQTEYCCEDSSVMRCCKSDPSINSAPTTIISGKNPDNGNGVTHPMMSGNTIDSALVISVALVVLLLLGSIASCVYMKWKKAKAESVVALQSVVPQQTGTAKAAPPPSYEFCLENGLFFTNTRSLTGASERSRFEDIDLASETSDLSPPPYSARTQEMHNSATNSFYTDRGTSFYVLPDGASTNGRNFAAVKTVF